MASTTLHFQLSTLHSFGALDFATIRVTCDGPSDLGDHVVVARTNQVCSVPLLAGATYAVESDLPISYSAVSSEHAHIVTNSATNLTVSLPLEFSLVQIQMRNGGDVRNYGISSVPVDVFANVFAVSGGCCSPQVLDGMMRWVCSPECTCGGETHGIATTALWEGYSKVFLGYAICGCGMDAPDPTPVPASGPHTASVSANFSRDAVIFESAYENKPGEWVSRRSTASELTIHANGGANGGALSVSAANLGKLQKNFGPAFPQQDVAVPAGQSITYVFNYVGAEASAATNDVVVTATFVENQTSETFASAATTTVVRVELEARNAAPANPDKHRHVFGVLESLYYRQYPSGVLSTWYFSEGEVELIPFSSGYMNLPATTNLTSRGHCEFHVSYGNVTYTNTFHIVLPQIEARNPRCNENLSMVRGEAGWLLLHLDIYVGPLYVSFHGVDFQEIPDESGNCPHDGYYNDIAKGGYLSHCESAGAGVWHRIRTPDSYLCSDRIGRAGRYDRPWLNGWKEWPIPTGWGADENLRAQFDVPPTTQKFILTSEGTFTIRKFGFEATRDISNHITIRSVGNE